MDQHQLPKGFQAAGFHGGVKEKGLDMALLHSLHPAASAGVFTTNRVQAACIQWNQERIGAAVRCIVANSGNANACTGDRGMADSHRIAETVSKQLKISSKEVLLASTGVIGVPLPIDAMCKSLASPIQLHQTATALQNAADAIMTTDTTRKIASHEFHIAGRTVRILGIAKGSGMIHPNMATMLGFLLTDIEIEASLLQKLLSESVDESFNMISVDGDTSTNDMVLALANAASGVAIKSSEDVAYHEFKKALKKVAQELAKQIARDGEGATKLLQVEVTGAKLVEDARLMARSVVSSNLVKAAIFGEDANWGRILAAMGYSGADFDVNGVSLDFIGSKERIMLLSQGEPRDFDEEKAARILSEETIRAHISLSDGQASATAWGCDLTYDYVKINGSYRT